MTSTQSVPSQVRLLDGSTGADREELGGKAASIDRMRTLGILVPPAFVLTTAVCRRFYANGCEIPEDVWAAVPGAVAELERVTRRTFGGGEFPLLVSVRSGAAVSMPGMMDTILNLGMNDEVEQALAAQSGDPAYASDTHRRFREQFEHTAGCAAPADVWQQLQIAVLTVLKSWQSERAIAYRRDRGVDGDGGTAVTVQAMVFGNLDDRSGTGVLFTRDPLVGGGAYGEWLPRGQGEDVVSGRANALGLDRLATSMPSIHRQLLDAAGELERAGQDVQDVEFTVESGTLWLLQSRAAKQAPAAALRNAIQLEREGVIGRSEALDRITAKQVEAATAPHIDPYVAEKAELLASGKPACHGIATGTAVVDIEDAEDRAESGERVVLVRPTTDPDDVAAMSLAAAVVTEFGGSTSHAAVSCRELGVPCIVGSGDGAVEALAGHAVTVDAAAGAVYRGELPIVTADVERDDDLAQLEGWLRGEVSAGTDASLPELLRAWKSRG